MSKVNEDAVTKVERRLKRRASTVDELAKVGDCDRRSVYRYLQLLHRIRAKEKGGDGRESDHDAWSVRLESSHYRP